MNAWTLAVLNFSIICLSIANGLCVWQIRKLSRRVFDLELDKMASEAAANFIKTIHERISIASPATHDKQEPYVH